MKWRVAVGVLVVFVAGVASGTFAGAWQARHAFAGRHGPRMAERMRERFQQELDLTPEQMRNVAPILDETAQRLQEIRRETGRRVSETVAESHQRLAEHLTPEQQAELSRQLEQRHHRFWRWHRKRDRPPRAR